MLFWSDFKLSQLDPLDSWDDKTDPLDSPDVTSDLDEEDFSEICSSTKMDF